MWQWHFSCCFSHHLVILGPPNTLLGPGSPPLQCRHWESSKVHAGLAFSRPFARYRFSWTLRGDLWVIGNVTAGPGICGPMAFRNCRADCWRGLGWSTLRMESSTLEKELHPIAPAWRPIATRSCRQRRCWNEERETLKSYEKLEKAITVDFKKHPSSRADRGNSHSLLEFSDKGYEPTTPSALQNANLKGCSCR